MRFYFVRHGQTEFNKQGIIQGREVDSPLTAAGIQGAKKLGALLADVPFTKAYVSPQQRARDTAHYILEENHYPIPPIYTDDRLRELYFGRFEGKPIASFEEHGYFDEYKNHPDTFDASTTGGETYYDLQKRGLAAFNDIVANSQQNDDILIVAHSIFLTVLTRTLLGIPMKDIRKEGILRNTSVTVIDVDENKKPHLITFDYVPTQQ